MADVGTQAVYEALQQLVGGLAEWSRGADDPVARAALRDDLLHLLDRVAPALAREGPDLRRNPPPRRVAVAMGLALHSQPHLGGTFDQLTREGSEPIGDPEHITAGLPLTVSGEAMERALGIAQWELDDLRDEVDRRAGRFLKQDRAVQWVWNHYGFPDTEAAGLVRALYPGLDLAGARVGLARRGGHLYAIAPFETSDPSALYLSWIPAPDADAISPVRAFEPSSVDRSLLRALGRGIGADDEESAELLARVLCLVPRASCASWLVADQFRTRGLAALVDLGTPYTRGNWLVRRLDPEACEWRSWLEVQGDSLVPTQAVEKVFHRLVLPRVQALLRQVYAQMLAALDQETAGSELGARPEDLQLYDIGGHLRAVLKPLLDWTGDLVVHKAIAHHLRLPLLAVEQCFVEIGVAWRRYAERTWYPADGQSRLLMRLLEHVVATNTSLRRLLHKQADLRWDHRELLLLFAAHYLREAPVERLWQPGLSDAVRAGGGEPAEDVAGEWFWSTWQRVLGEVEREAMVTGRF